MGMGDSQNQYPARIGPGGRPGHGRFLRIMGWILAIGLSLGLNLFLFGIMPGLIHTVSDKFQDLEDIRAIQVVRVKRPEPPAKKKEKPKPPKPEPEKLKPLTRAMAPVPEKIRPKLPFELNPRLPALPNSLQMPPLSHFSMKAQGPRGLYLASELDGPLMALATVPPVYPLRASRLGIQGWVKVRFVVTREGRVENIEILDAKPKGVFDTAVVNCVSQWRFKPGTVEGTAVAAQAQTTVRFELEQ